MKSAFRPPGVSRPNVQLSSTLPVIDTYNRNFSGGYVVLVQDFGASPLSAVLKYDWYDPNTKLSDDEAKTDGDMAVNTFGFGLLWRANNNVKLTAFYEMNQNETTVAIDKYKADLKDNLFTLRLQYKF
jgi:phosphate-selective porin